MRDGEEHVLDPQSLGAIADRLDVVEAQDEQVGAHQRDRLFVLFEDDDPGKQVVVWLVRFLIARIEPLGLRPELFAINLVLEVRKSPSNRDVPTSLGS